MDIDADTGADRRIGSPAAGTFRLGTRRPYASERDTRLEFQFAATESPEFDEPREGGPNRHDLLEGTLLSNETVWTESISPVSHR